MSAAEIALAAVGVVLAAAVALLAARVGSHGRRAARFEARVQPLEREREAGRQERARLEAALEAADVGVLVAGADGEVVYANPAALPYLRGRPGDAIVESQVGEAVADALSRGEGQSREFELYVPRRRVVRLEAAPLTGETGESLGAVAYITDVSEQRRVEAMRRDFVAAAGHELKTPLGALALLAETLVARVGDPDAAGGLAERIQSEAGRLARLVDDMLDLSRVEEPVVVSDPVPVAALVAEVVEEARPGASRRGVQLVAEAPSPGVVVLGDERQLRSMLANLVDNAVKYSDPQPGRTPPRVWVRSGEEDQWVVLEVEDEGIGIPEGHHERIFERFYRVDRARSRATGGTGLGLAIVRHVALNHGGEVGLESRLGEGSRFRVRLPKWRES